MSQFKTNLCCSNKQSANFAVNRKEELFSFSTSVHLQVGISSAPHQLHPQSPAEEQAPRGSTAGTRAEEKENTTLTVSAQK